MESKKQDLVHCIRMLEAAGIFDYNGHASIKTTENRLLINEGSCRRSSLTVKDICEIDFDGNLISGNGNPPLEFHLHVSIYKARPDVEAIVHAHPKWSTFLSMTGNHYEPVYAQGTLLHPVPCLDSPNSINNTVMAELLADILSDRPAALMKSHGTVTVGKTIDEAFVLSIYLEENSFRQYMGLQIGKPYIFSAEEIDKCKKILWNPKLFKRTWNHFMAKLPPTR